MPLSEATSKPAGGAAGGERRAVGSTSEPRRFWLWPVVALTGITAFIFIAGYLADFSLAGQTKYGWFGTLFRFDRETCQNTLGNLAQVIGAVLGIAITVVSIIVQLAATRYTPRVAEMFFRDRTNLAILTFFVVGGTYSMWAAMAVTGEVLPRISIIIAMVFMTASLMLLVPYFVYVFDFMDPGRVIARIQEQALAAARGKQGPRDIDGRQGRVLAAIEQLADVGVNAISQKDRGIAAAAVDALMELTVRYLPEKPHLEKEWFRLGPRLVANPDFVAMTESSLDDLVANQSWVEFKVLRQFQTVFGESVSEMRDVARAAAIDTRYIGEAALRADDREALALAIKFFNTYLRAAINASEVRTAYNVLNQYRLLVDAVLRTGREEVALQFARHLSYYGQVAQARNLGFLTETAAYDLCALCETAFEVKAQNQRAMLGVFLDVDRESESEEQEITLRGVRKAQVKLATFYLLHGATELARTIYADMAGEKPDRLASIREELLSITTKDFWEVIDRGSNFDYLEPERKQQLHTFFSWFPQLAQATPAAPSA